jgi:type VII secretion-associated protein (TIGR03931 family)
LVSTVISTVLEIGPAVVRSHPTRQSGAKVRVDADKTSNSAELISAALAGIDDTTVLFREQPVAVADLWRRVIAASVETRCESLTVVHPSWWVRHRVARIVDAAATLVTDVRALSRSAVISADDPAIVVEIADDVVAISSCTGPPVVLIRPGDPCDAAQAIETEPGTEVLIDVPPGVAGAAEYARALRATLRQRGAAARLAGIHDVPPPASVVELPPAATPPRPWRGPALAAASVALTVCAIGVATERNRAPTTALEPVNLVEGRVTLRIPPQWTVARITAGPGSRRIQASSPSEPGVALHATQSYAPGETLDRTADILRQAIAEQPRGVFVDFNAADRRAGRPAVTYREVRVGRDIRWTVVLDGSTRISVGCQSAPGREDTVADPCEKAIESAHELTGTKDGT